MYSSKEGGPKLPVKIIKGIIGIQGQQGCDEHYYLSTGCTGINHHIDTKNVTNIYNYLQLFHLYWPVNRRCHACACI